MLFLSMIAALVLLSTIILTIFDFTHEHHLHPKPEVEETKDNTVDEEGAKEKESIKEEKYEP